MLFSSLIFILYFLPIAVIGYYALSFSRRLQNYFLFLISLFFYAWGEPSYALLMLASITGNYIFGLLVAHRSQHRRKILGVGILFNLAILFYYKYAVFLLANLFPETGVLDSFRNIILPLGISFYTFQSISYLIDVFRERVRVQKNPLYLGMYIAFFPQLIAGPIVRYNEIEDQIVNRCSTWEKFSVGFCLFATGLAKKIFIANSMGAVTDHIFLMAAVDHVHVSTSLALLGVMSYSFQIYFDFSAYSDMAIGLGLMFGFKLPMNFNYPYISTSITEFWRRWHITLGAWFRDYVYFPMGGSRVPYDRVVFNLLIVWLLTGIWHGAEWTFVLWGLLHFICIAGEKLFKLPTTGSVHSFSRHLYVITVLLIGWTLFRVENLTEAGKYFSCLFGKYGFWSDQTWMFLKENAVYYVLAVIFCQPITGRFKYMLANAHFGGFGKVIMSLYAVAVTAMFALSVVWLVKGAYNPFIYFRF
ncbi:alginate O-acetylation protein [Betaproteobacteria bacterium]|nr:alginate O-acetylation protein [Betaproteobacteria bacterium]GHU42692.1 alginate O-acetylation protein [Betaproteobacteria bacterium]